MARNRKRHKEDEHIDESWLIPYADILTLLLALFIVLFAMSSIDAVKFKELARSLNTAFTGGTGVLEYPNPQEPLVWDEKTEDLEKKRLDAAAIIELEELKELQEEINEYIVDNDLTDSLTTELSGEGLSIAILDNALFDSGSANVKKEAVDLGMEISKYLVSNPPRSMTISGHTDNVPIHNAEYSSNWHLSVMRSINFMQVLLEKGELDPANLSAKGYGEFQPIASNDNKTDRAKNRRVEVLVVPNYELPIEEIE